MPSDPLRRRARRSRHNGPDEEGGSETAFGGDQDGEGPRWWFYAEYNVCCDEEPPILTCETAFAKGGYVFTTQARSNPEGLPSLRLTRNRWGWAINLADPEDLGTTTYDIWAGAGLNNTSNGTLVGTLTIDWDGLNLTVSYDLDDSYVLKEVHIYVGQDEPTTVAPGQYGYTRYFDPPVSSHNAEFDLADDGDGVWVIAHAVVCSD